MQGSEYLYHHNNETFHGYLVGCKKGQKRPAVLVAHDWSGRNAFACEKAQQLAEMGYIGFAIDLFGQGRVGETVEEKQNLAKPLFEDRVLLRDRVLAGFQALVAREEVDSTRVAGIGFCFGGLSVLDLARSGANVRGVVSFHGLLNQPEGLAEQPIQAKILVLHGYDDPMVPPEQVNAFCQEMTQAGADWQVHMYGHVQHAFTNPKAHDPVLGTIYNETAEQRSMQAMRYFLEEIFA